MGQNSKANRGKASETEFTDPQKTKEPKKGGRECWTKELGVPGAHTSRAVGGGISSMLGLSQSRSTFSDTKKGQDEKSVEMRLCFSAFRSAS